MKMKQITIFTPTYNRQNTLKRLYSSLRNQTTKEFVWLIVDDGSTDNTKEEVEKWIKEGEIQIEYIKQKNQGKHIAHNTGVENCKTKYFICVDSDDYILEQGVENILEDCKVYGSNCSIAGSVSLKLQMDLHPVGTELPKNINYSSLSDLYESHKFKGDTALVFKTDILRKYKFPYIEGEKFVGEEYIYCQIDKEYKLFVSKNKFYVCEYLEDGYSKNMNKIIINNPRGYMELKRMKLKCTDKLAIQLKSAALYLIGGWLSHSPCLISNSPKKVITLISIPLAIVVYFKKFKNYINN